MSKRLMVIAGVAGAVLVVAVVGFGLSNLGRLSGKDEAAPLTSTAPLVASNALLNDGGGVQVQVTYQKDAPSAKTLVFRVSLNTHSVELGQYDLSKLSLVTLDPGGPLADFEWKAEGAGGGHHVNGTLTVKDPTGLVTRAKTVKLEIRDLAGVAVRQFQWPLGNR